MKAAFWSLIRRALNGEGCGPVVNENSAESAPGTDENENTRRELCHTGIDQLGALVAHCPGTNIGASPVGSAATIGARRRRFGGGRQRNPPRRPRRQPDREREQAAERQGDLRVEGELIGRTHLERQLAVQQHPPARRRSVS